MSLIPYHPQEGREIVLRHRNAVVVRDPASHRLEIRGSTCPTCHQGLPQPNAADHSYDRAYDVEDDSYMDPDYFRMLRRGNHGFPSPRGPPSPVRSLPRPAFDSSSHRPSPEVIDEDDESEVSPNFESPRRRGSRIRREAFSPKYFQSFFVEERVLGKGGKGEVLLVRHQIDGCHLGYFACKRVPVGDDHAWLEKVLVEVELLAKLSHPNLVSYRHVWLEDVRLSLFAPSVVCAFILQQFCNGGDLHTYVVGNAPAASTKEQLKERMRRRSKGQPEIPTNLNKSQLALEEIYSIFKDITTGVAYLHASDYIHRDLKPGNCLLHRQGDILTCLISDFGEVQPGNKARTSTGATGTISYCAPEVLKMNSNGLYGNFTTKSDMFSLGMILYFMCFGRLPYDSANVIQEELEDIEMLRAEITDWKGYKDERRERPDLPAKLYKLLNRLLALDPNERPSANEVLNAMKTETNFDGLTRPERVASPNIGLGSSRIQNLDSPANPGTPEPESQMNRRSSRLNQQTRSWSPVRESDIAESSFNAEYQTGLVKSNTSHGQSFGASHHDEHYHRPTINTDLRRHSSHDLATPLLLPPPRTRFEELQHRAVRTVFRTCSAIGLQRHTVVYAARIGIFGLKLTTLTRPCWPYMPNLQVSIPLISVAVLDLAFHPNPRQHTRQLLFSSVSRGPWTAILLLTFHFVVLWLAGEWNTLCARAPRNDWAEW